tara:strand:+ start:841 stop:2265 length:1425 start_codon:yes stop_codon:yes gene_type:complete
MSYENPNSPKYIPTAARSKEVGDAMLGVVKSRMEEKEEAEQLEKDRLKADRINELAWGDELGESFEGQQQEGVLNTAYRDTGKYAADLNRMITDQPDLCQSDNCRDEINQRTILKGLPDKSIAMLGTFESYLPILDEINVDKSQPLYTKMLAARGIIKKMNGFGSNNGYGVEVVLNKKDGKYTGSQEIVLKAPCKKDTVDGCPFGESGEWKINSETLQGYENNPESSGLLVSTPNWKKQAAGLDSSSGVFEDNDPLLGLNKDFLNKVIGENNVEEPAMKTVTKPMQNKAGDNVTVAYQVYDYDTDKIRAKVGGYIAAEVDVMFDKTSGGPNTAIAMWNNVLSGTAKDKIAEAKTKGQTITVGLGMYATSIKIDDLKFINKDGTMDYYAADTKVNPAGTLGSIYAKNGELKPVVKQLYKQVYTDHYMDTNIADHITKANETQVPGTVSEMVKIDSAEDQLARNKVKYADPKNLPN